ncbi:class I SAM-dependent methyltransferase [Ktedonosporobacter rubrisoli]|nr:class I SAM-dependent methyltransferase [Ktedonosporobacter rubrisoli]
MHLFRFFRRARKGQGVSTRWEPGPCPLTSVKGGRRWREDIPYALPKDLQENDRLHYQHYVFKTLLGGNYHAPLERVGNILDVGCGPGYWMLEIAQQFPQARISGLDTEFALPPGPVASNCRFVQGNILHGLPFAEQSFDYTHQRLLVAALPSQAWPWEIKELLRVTRLGGWVELIEAGDGFAATGPQTERFLSWTRAALRMRGIDAGIIANIGRWLEEAGAREVVFRTLSYPLGSWAGHEGVLWGKDVFAGFLAIKGLLNAQLGVPLHELEAVLAQIPQEWDRYRTCNSIYVAYGKK